MKYLKLFVIVALVWGITYSGGVVLSLRAVGGAPAAFAQRLILPDALRPASFAYRYQGKTYTATKADLDKYESEQAAKPLQTLLMQASGADKGQPGAYLLAKWCTKVLPWLALITSLWLMNLAAGIRRLADTLA